MKDDATHHLHTTSLESKAEINKIKPACLRAEQLLQNDLKTEIIQGLCRDFTKAKAI